MQAELNDIAREHLERLGLSGDVAAMVELWLSPEDGNGGSRANITIGYMAGDRRRETAMSSLPDLDAALEVLADRGRVATILSLGFMAMPRNVRPALPDWIVRDEAAVRARRDLRRASSLADAEARGKTVDHVDDRGGDAPF